MPSATKLLKELKAAVRTLESSQFETTVSAIFLMFEESQERLLKYFIKIYLAFYKFNTHAD